MGFGIKASDVTAIKERTDRLPDSPANQVTSTAVKERTDRLPNAPADNAEVIAISRRLELWSAPTSLTLNTTPTDTTLPSITIAGLPADAVPRLAKAHIKVGAVLDDSASLNYLSGDQELQAQKAVGGAWITLGTAPGGALLCPASSPGAGDVFGGDQNIKAQIPANGEIVEFQWLQALALGDNLYLNAVQVILVIDYDIVGGS